MKQTTTYRYITAIAFVLCLLAAFIILRGGDITGRGSEAVPMEAYTPGSGVTFFDPVNDWETNPINHEPWVDVNGDGNFDEDATGPDTEGFIVCTSKHNGLLCGNSFSEPAIGICVQTGINTWSCRSMNIVPEWKTMGYTATPIEYAWYEH